MIGRDAATGLLLPLVPEHGWTEAALALALRRAGEDAADAPLLFPNGQADMLEAFSDLSDRRMRAGAAAIGLSELRLPARVRALIALRLRQKAPHKEAVRRAVALFALPRHARLATRCLARTVGAIWEEAGDRSADFSWYSKRAILAGVYSSTLLYWLRDDSEDDAMTLAFLDRRLADVAGLGRWRARAAAAMGRLRPAGP